MVAAGADVNDMGSLHGTALMSASSTGRTETVKYLISVRADVNAKKYYGYTALLYASQNGYIKIVKALIAAGADVNAKITSGDNKGKTALSLVCTGYNANKNNKSEIERILKAAGAK